MKKARVLRNSLAFRQRQKHFEKVFRKTQETRNLSASGMRAIVAFLKRLG